MPLVRFTISKVKTILILNRFVIRSVGPLRLVLPLILIFSILNIFVRRFVLKSGN